MSSESAKIVLGGFCKIPSCKIECSFSLFQIYKLPYLLISTFPHFCSRKPKSLAGSEAGDFADVAYYVLRSRCPDKGQMTLEDVDSHLTAIAENYAAKNHGNNCSSY